MNSLYRRSFVVKLNQCGTEQLRSVGGPAFASKGVGTNTPGTPVTRLQLFFRQYDKRGNRIRRLQFKAHAGFYRPQARLK